MKLGNETKNVSFDTQVRQFGTVGVAPKITQIENSLIYPYRTNHRHHQKIKKFAVSLLNQAYSEFS